MTFASTKDHSLAAWGRSPKTGRPPGHCLKYAKIRGPAQRLRVIPSKPRYDAENRIVSANAGAVLYGYDAQNKRVWQGNFTNGLLATDAVTMFGADGRMLGSYAPYINGTTVTFQAVAQRAYFGGKLVGVGTPGSMQSSVQDRLGSVGAYYPYGEDRNAPPTNDNVKFATYTRDSATGLDYADQRYYASTFGRYMTPDPARSSAVPGDPESWNRFAYTRGDPTNRFDPLGLDDSDRECQFVSDGPGDCEIFGGPGGGGGGGGDFTSPTDLARAYGIIAEGAQLTADNVNWGLLINDLLGQFEGVVAGALPGEGGFLTIVQGLMQADCSCPLPLSKVDWGAIWDDIVSFLKKQTFGKLRSLKWRVSCYVHVIGGENHQADEQLRVEVLAPDAETAFALGKAQINAMALARYGPTGWQLLHCDIINVN
jgi:RHS repeat-associated protein